MPRNPFKAARALFPHWLSQPCLSICLSVSLLVCPSLGFFALSLSLSQTHTCMHTGQIGSAQSEQKMKARGSCVHASGAVWVGKWWKRGSFSKLTAPFRILHLLHHERPESFSSLSYPHQARRNCHIPLNINNDSVSILVGIHCCLHKCTHLISTQLICVKQAYWCLYYKLKYERNASQDWGNTRKMFHSSVLYL